MVTTCLNIQTVLLNEAVDGLAIKPDGIYVDCTLGGAGHSSLILSKLGENGQLIAFDQDETAIANAKEKLSAHRDKLTIIKSNFLYLQKNLKIWEFIKSMEFFMIWVFPVRN